ncbi:hypothetical protein HK101_010733 [Irineochytrium annulatum]|nr:hypothetical protein HK101_010733 [Irineochytrium annulatum]
MISFDSLLPLPPTTLPMKDEDDPIKQDFADYSNPATFPFYDSMLTGIHLGVSDGLESSGGLMLDSMFQLKNPDAGTAGFGASTASPFSVFPATSASSTTMSTPSFPVGAASPSSTASINSFSASSSSGNDSILTADDAATMMCWDDKLLSAQLDAAVASVGAGMVDPLGLGMLSSFDPSGVELANIMAMDVGVPTPISVMPSMSGLDSTQGVVAPVDEDGILDGIDDDDNDMDPYGLGVSASTSALLETIRTLPANMTVSPARQPTQHLPQEHLPQQVTGATLGQQDAYPVKTRGLKVFIPAQDLLTPPGDVIEYSEVEEAESDDDYVQPISRSYRGRGRGRGGRRGSVSKRNHHPYKVSEHKSKVYLSPETISPSDDLAPHLPLANASVAPSVSVHDDAESPPRRRGPGRRRGSLAGLSYALPRRASASQPSDPTAPTGGSTCRPVPGSEKLYERSYSSVSVYELTANGTAVMRRCSDGWVNATHMLKAAGFTDKAKRTKVLEKEVHSGKHEKVQGGYGKYQGTWVPLEKAKSLAEKFECYDVLKEILDR